MNRTVAVRLPGLLLRSARCARAPLAARAYAVQHHREETDRVKLEILQKLASLTFDRVPSFVF